MVDVQKELKIKTGVVKRLVKEHACYIKEVSKEEAKIKEMTEDPEIDPYVVKKRGEVLQETRSMIGHTARRVQEAVVDLKKLLENESLAAENEMVVEARNQVAAAEAIHA